MICHYFNEKNNIPYLWNYNINKKTPISKKLYDLLMEYPQLSISNQKQVLDYLSIDKSFFEESKKNVGFTFFDSEQITLTDLSFGNKKKDFIFIGFPYDLGATQYRGSKFGPDILRYTSTSIINNKDLVTHSISVGDLGNVSSSLFKSNGKEFDFVSNVVEFLISRNTIPIVIGGDHSISLATLKGASKAKSKFGIIHFDAHQDFYGVEDYNNWQNKLNHSNFLNFLVNNNEIDNVYQFGIRNKFLFNRHNKLKTYDVGETIRNYKEIIKSLNKEIPYFITFDVDCLSTSIMKSTGTPLAGGFEYREIHSILTYLINEINVIGIDIVELTDEYRLDAMLVNQLIIDLIYGINRRKNIDRYKEDY